MNINFENGKPVTTVDFDYGAIDHEQVSSDQFSELWRDLLEWILSPDTRQYIGAGGLPSQKLITDRLFVIIWIVTPEALDDVSLSALATRLGVTKQYMSILATEFSDRFGLRSRRMKSPQQREYYRRLARAVLLRPQIDQLSLPLS